MPSPHPAWGLAPSEEQRGGPGGGCQPLTPTRFPAVLVPGRGLAAVLKMLPMFHDEEYARARGLPEDTLVLP